MHRLRSRPALQENVDVLKSTNLNKASKKENICDASEKHIDASIIANHLCTNPKQVKSSNRKTCKSNKENLIFLNSENDATENKAKDLTVSPRQRALETKRRCAQKRDKIDDKLSSHNKDSRKLHVLRPRENLQVADEKIVAFSKQPSIRKTHDEISVKTRIATRSNEVGQNNLKKTESDSKLKTGSGRLKKIVKEKKSLSKLCDSLNQSKIDSYLVKKNALPKAISVKHCPIWKKGPPQTSKRNSEYDVYDILQDEDMASEKPVKVKKRRVPAKNNIKTKKITKPKTKKDPKRKKTDITSKTNIVDMDSDEIPMDVQCCESEVFQKNGETVMASPCKRVSTNPLTVPETIVSNLLKELDESFPKSSTNSITVPVTVDSNLLREPEESVPKPSTNLITVPETIVSNLLKELDVSFPKTSTPQARTASKNVGLLRRNFGEETSTIAEISCIPNPQSCGLVETILQTPKGSPRRNMQQKNPTDFDKVPKNKFIYDFEVNHDFEITLFESPPKDLKKKNSNKKQKKIVLDLTETKWKKPSVDDPEIRVLEPRKSYYSPDLVTRHIARTKRTNISEKQKPPAKKSRQELLIEKMNKEFEDISSLELCVE